MGSPDSCGGGRLVEIPESPEVIAQVVRDLTSLYLRVKRGGGSPYQNGLAMVLARLANQPGQALQVGFVLGNQLATPMRAELNLGDPEAGLYFETDEAPRDGEYAAANFINMVLRERYADAEQIFHTLHRDAREIYAFLGLLLALASHAS